MLTLKCSVPEVTVLCIKLLPFLKNIILLPSMSKHEKQYIMFNVDLFELNKTIRNYYIFRLYMKRYNFYDN